MDQQTTTVANTEVINTVDQVEIIFYTDPLCCWSWAFEPHWRRLQYEYEGKLKVRYCMGGMIPSWKDYHDELNSVTRPIQMGPVWLHASHTSGMPMNTIIWMQNPPASSYPACIAVKCAQLQSSEFGERYLRLTREEVMLNGKNIAEQVVLVDIAKKLRAEQPAFDLQRFEQDLVNTSGLEAFRKDMNEVQTRGIARFPTLIIKGPQGKAVLITGFRPYPALVEALKQVLPGIEKRNQKATSELYKNYWKNITEQEVLEGIKEY